MNKSVPRFVGFVGILAVTASQARGGVIKVDDDGGAGIAFKQISAAVGAAADGDVILVESGTYKRFTVDDKSLVIHADVSANVIVTGTITIENLAADKSVVLRGLYVPGLTSLSLDALILDNDAGFVRIDESTFKGAPGAWGAPFGHPTGYAGAVVTNSASIAFDRCTLGGGLGASQQPISLFGAAPGGPGLLATGSNVVTYDCFAYGATGGDSGLKAAFGGSGGNGAQIDGASLFASGSQLSGGGGGFAYYGGSGGDGLFLAGGAQASLLGDTLQGGSASPGFGNPGTPGDPIDAAGGSVVTLDDTARHFSVTSPSREGAILVAQFNGLPNEAVFLLYALQPGQQTLGASKGSFLLGSAFQLLVVGITDGTGVKTFSSVVPELGLGVDALTLHCQAVFAGTGGGLVLGGLSIELLLDASL